MDARLLIADSVSSESGLSVDDALTRCASDTLTLRLYTYQPCVLVGRFQHVEDEIHVENCASLGIPINRRPTGGGSIIMGPDQLGVALVVPHNCNLFGRSSTTLMSSCAEGILRTLRDFGIDAQFRGKNDLVVNGRKIAGLGLYQAAGGGILFHASILLDLDVAYMLKLLKSAFTADSDGGLKSVSERITTVCQETDSNLSISELRKAVTLGYEKEFAIQFEADRLSDSEQELADELCESQYSNRQWVHQSGSNARDGIGYYQLRTDGGTLDVRAIVARRVVKSVFFKGDFIASENAVSDLESSLRWHDCDADSLNETIVRSHKRNGQFWNQITANDITSAVLGAIDQSATGNTGLTPNACFAREELVR